MLVLHKTCKYSIVGDNGTIASQSVGSAVGLPGFKSLQSPSPKDVNTPYSFCKTHHFIFPKKTKSMVFLM